MKVARQLPAFAAQPLVVRMALLALLAIAVMVGGVMAGALVVAPVVAKATSPAATAQFQQTLASTSSAARAVVTQARGATQHAINEMPAPVTQFALPVLVVLSMIGGLSVLFVKRRSPTRSLRPSLAGTDLLAMPTRSTSRATPRSTGRIGSRNQRTPQAVEALVASGASTTDIARRTGLPIDAIQLLLSMASGGRQLQPPTA